MKDSRIIKLFIKRSENAIKELSKKYKVYMYSISHNILRSNEDVEECLNDAFLKIWLNIPPIIPHSLKAYASKVIRNLSLDRYRKLNADKRGKGQIEVVFDELEEILDCRSCVEESILSKELVEEINIYLGGISKEKRRMFILRYFYAYKWPGNVRELKNCVERVTVMSNDNLVVVEDLPREFKNKCSGVSFVRRNEKTGTLKEALEKVEREMIENAFKEHGNVRSAAKALGLGAATFVRKRQKYENRLERFINETE